MKIKAITNFAGAVTMHEGETRTCKETSTIRELIEAGYVEVLEPDPDAKPAKQNGDKGPEEAEEPEDKKAGKKK